MRVFTPFPSVNSKHPSQAHKATPQNTSEVAWTMYVGQTGAMARWRGSTVLHYQHAVPNTNFNHDMQDFAPKKLHCTSSRLQPTQQHSIARSIRVQGSGRHSRYMQ